VLAGTRDSFGEASMIEGPRAGARLASGPWEVELSGYMAVNASRLSEEDRVELEVASGLSGSREFFQVVDNDRAAVALLWSWGPRGEAGWWGGPRVVAGLELRQVRRTWWAQDGGLAVNRGNDDMLVPGAALGFAFDARLGGPLGLRLSVLDRLWFGPARDYQNVQARGERRLFQDPTLALDLAWNFAVGGER
jgi:hypothetical protein